MLKRMNKKGFTLVELLIAIAVLAIFTVGVYSTLISVYKIIRLAKIKTLETAILSEELEVARNLPYNQVGLQDAFDVPGILLPTKYLTRQNLEFKIINTVRFIDDPYDGTITSTPQDTTPADYKLVEMEIYCLSIDQKTPLILSTIIGPNIKEDESNLGALFIEVVDSLGRPVPQADVHIEMSGSSSYKDDVTDNNGHLYIINVPTGTFLYDITVSKDGYTTDATVSTTAENPTPVKPFATVLENKVAELSFSIDTPSNLQIKTLSPTCASIGNASLHVYGKKLLGLPELLKFDEVSSTNASGILNFENIEWDEYFFAPSGTSYNLGGSIPMLSLNLNAGETQVLTLVLRPYELYPLLVSVKDNITGMPISDATVNIISTSTGFSDTYQTGLGYSQQTDWSGGSGQLTMSDFTKYYSDDNKLDISEEGKIVLKKIGGDYYEEGCLMSSIFDVGEEVDFRNIFSEPYTQPVEVGTGSIKIQIATSDTSTPVSWDFLGPDGTGSTSYSFEETAINSAHDDHRYFRYQICLSTASTTFTPEVNDIFFTYTNDCVPPGQVFFSPLDFGSYFLEVIKDGYLPVTTTVEIPTTSHEVVNMLSL
jgi:prepilin-type N-terminal cleavage/methylation domain-containing protein